MPWVALVPLLAVAARASAAGAFAAGVGYGLVLFAATVAWVVEAVAAYFASGIVGAVLFSAAICLLFVAVYVGLFAVAARALLRRGSWRALLAIPALWVTYEWARATLLTGLPWELLGHALWRRLALVQIADVTGVYGVSYVIAAVNVGLYLVLRATARTSHPKRLLRAAAPLATALAMVAAVATYGATRLAHEAGRPAGEPYVVAVAQANPTVRWEWQRADAERSLLAYARLSRQAIRERRPDLVIWPEYSVMLYPGEDPVLLPVIADLARGTRAGVVFGAPRAGGSSAERRYFNAAFHVAPDGTLSSSDKVHLVPFAEYRPWSIGEAIAADDDRSFSAGGGPTVLASDVGRLGTLICYEVIFPELARALVREGAEVLVNLSNDGWLDRAGLGAGAQHLSIAVFRAIETRRYLARAASTGISGFIDPAGRPFALLGEGQAGVTAGVIRPRTDLTLYCRFGDVFAAACALGGLGALGFTVRRKRRR
jgi:apolipoprotein N-acyltransferase